MEDNDSSSYRERGQVEVTFAWWNTSLSHGGKPPSTGHSKGNDARNEATLLVRHLFSRYALDVLAVGEVSAEDLSHMSAVLGADFETLAFNDAWGRRKIGDLGMIVRKSTATTSTAAYQSHFIESRTLAIGVVVRVNIAGTCFSLVISHWPSRLHMPRHSPDRQTYGVELRRVLERIKGNADPSHVVLLGDYNDEPFDDSLASHLMATRDTSRLRRTRFVSYNPFWRKLGTHEAHLDAEPGQQVAGSYRYISGRDTTWFTFDQMIFCRDFLLGGAWRLNERRTGIVADTTALNLIRNPSFKFDHLPIIGVAEAYQT
jgi:hypothetical protein